MSKVYAFESKICNTEVVILVDTDRIIVQSAGTEKLVMDTSCQSIEELFMKLSYFEEQKMKAKEEAKESTKMKCKLARIRSILEE